MALTLFPLCKTVRTNNKEGIAGEWASMVAPFYNQIYFFSGQTVTFPSATIGQDQSTAFYGQRKNTPFVKAYGVCINDNENNIPPIA